MVSAKLVKLELLELAISTGANEKILVRSLLFFFLFFHFFNLDISISNIFSIELFKSCNSLLENTLSNTNNLTC